MALELPGYVLDVFALVGLPWPNVDEDELRGWAGDLRGFAGRFTDLASQSHRAVVDLAEVTGAESLKALAAEWDRFNAVLADFPGPAGVFADALDVAADVVVAQKGAVIAAAVALAAEFTATQVGAFFSFGLDEAAVPEEVLSTRVLVRAALQDLESRLLGALCNVAGGELSRAVESDIFRLAQRGGAVVGGVQTLTVDYHALRAVQSYLSARDADTADVSGQALTRATGRQIETTPVEGGWHVGRIIVQFLERIAEVIFRQLPEAFRALLTDTWEFLGEVVSKFRRADEELAADAHSVTPAGQGTQEGVAVAGVGAAGAGSAIGGGSGSGAAGIGAGGNGGSGAWVGAGGTGEFSDADRAAVWDYTTNDGYKTMNPYYRNPESYTPEEAAAIQARSDRVSAALAKLPPRPGTTYRGVDLPGDALSNYEEGTVVTERAFTSTSTDPAIASGNFKGNAIIIISGKSGRDISEFSQYSYEKEILYDKGTKFYVTGKSFDSETGKWTIRMREAG